MFLYYDELEILTESPQKACCFDHRQNVLIDGKTCLSSVVGMGSQRQVVSVDDGTSEESSERFI